MWVCSVLESLSGGALSIEEIGAVRETHVRGRIGVVEDAEAWRTEPAPARAERFAVLLDGSQRWRRRADLTRHEPDAAVAEDIAVAAASEAARDPRLLVHAFQAF